MHLDRMVCVSIPEAELFSYCQNMDQIKVKAPVPTDPLVLKGTQVVGIILTRNTVIFTVQHELVYNA